MTWGPCHSAGDSSNVQERLVNVKQVKGSLAAFAALRADGTIVTWGDPAYGGLSQHVQPELVDVQSVAASDGAFATLTSWLQSLGWDEVGAFHWRHSDIQVDIQWSHPLSPAEGEKEKHHIRETWRRLLFDQFLASSRRDSQAVGNPAYDEAWITRARKLFQEADTHGRAVMVGAVVSDARYDRMKRREIAHCQWCRDPDAIPGWVHHAWECPAFAQGRPLTPDNAFQKILGWPVGQSAVDRSVLDHLALVRSRVLDQRYRGTGL